MTTDLERRLREPLAWQCLHAKGDMSYWRNSQAPIEAAHELARLRAENEVNLAAMLWAAEEFDEERGETPDGWFGHCRKNIVAGLSEEHCGDCTNVPQSCMKCWADHYLERARQALQEGPRHESDLVEKLRKAADCGQDEFDVLSPQDAAIRKLDGERG